MLFTYLIISENLVGRIHVLINLQVSTRRNLLTANLFVLHATNLIINTNNNANNLTIKFIDLYEYARQVQEANRRIT